MPKENKKTNKEKNLEERFKNKRLKTYKDYAMRYKISTINKDLEIDNPKYYRKINDILNDIYLYEKENRPNNPLYPFFNLSL
jgi:hypothetical protein